MKSPQKLDAAILHEIAARVAETAGIEPSTLDARRVEWTVGRRVRHLHLADASAYLAHLSSSANEQAEIVDALLIQETQFFRDAAIFEEIAPWARCAAQTAQGPLRVLSAPCSTGQEAYSLAATLAHAGLELDSFVIEAFDLSPTAIAHARKGIYPESALKRVPAALASACGVVRNHHWHMHEGLRKRICFERRNLIEPSALGCGASYHLILCRNLFIYLHAQGRAALANSLAQALLPGGRLIIGAADRVPELDAFFAPIRPASSFAFIHKEQIGEPPQEVSFQAFVPAIREKRPRERGLKDQAVRPLVTAAEFYQRASEHYNLGNLRMAERRCRQALYLAPGYLPALELLQTLWHLHPSLRARDALKARIHRIRKHAQDLVEVRPGERIVPQKDGA